MVGTTVELVDKHVFLIGDNDKFFYLQADSLINKAGVNQEHLCAIVLPYSDVDEFDSLRKLEGVTYLKYSECLLAKIIKSKSITVMSLTCKNSWLVNSLLDLSSCLLSRLYLFITDDEVDRWSYVYNKNGVLIEDEKRLIGPDDLVVLSKINYFIAKETTFKPLISKVLERDVDIIDCGIVFDTLPVKSHSMLDELLIDNPSSRSVKLLYGTKGMPTGEVVNFLLLCTKLAKKINKFNLVLLSQNPFKIMLFELFRLSMKVFKKKTLHIDYLNITDPFTYTVNVMSCSHIVLQGRGGASTARTFVKLGRGILCIKDLTHNADFFENSYNVKVLKYCSIEQLANKILNENVDLNINSKVLEKVEVDSLHNFKKLYK